MNYRHAFHAGNFADILKHAVLLLCLERLALKEKPFRVIDTHAGRGRYDLTSDAAQRSPEWRDGIGRLWPPDRDRVADEPAGLALLLAAVTAAQGPPADGAATPGLRVYPGSPALIAHAMRPQDRAHMCELHPHDAEIVRAEFRRDRRITVQARDGYGALKALLPPLERRGLVLIDPPFEARDEFDRLAHAMTAAWRRWATGIYILWRPLKDDRASARFDAAIAAVCAEAPARPAQERLLRADLWVRTPTLGGSLAGAGVLVVNPPFGLREQLARLAPWLAARLAQGDGARWRLDHPVAAHTAQ